ncbi:MAG: peptidylprolyl isomerase [Planctomycetes bacterium]|nr:peptidylprolyl isomerase [Planctomycetota bacterium]
MRNMLLGRLLPALIIAGAAGAAGFVAGAQDTPKPTEKTLKVNEVARVGQSVITAEDFIERLLEVERILYADRRNGGMVIDDLVAERMLELEAERIGITVKPRETGDEEEELNKLWLGEFQRWNEEVLADQRKRGAKEQKKTWVEFLRDRFGMTEADYKRWLNTTARRNLKLRLVVNYWEESNERAEAWGIRVESKELAAQLRQRLVQGESFTNLARNHSNESRTREFGGKIGNVWRNDGRLDTEVEVAFWKLKKDGISEPVETQHGWWLVVRKEGQLGNEAPFWDLRETLLKRPNVSQNRFQAWRNAVAASGRYAYERRMPGWDCAANQP